MRLQFGFEEDEPATNVVELPISACGVSGLVMMLSEMDGGSGADAEEIDASVLVVGIDLPPAEGVSKEVDLQALRAVKSFLTNLAAERGVGEGSPLIPVPLPTAVTSVQYYLYTLLGTHDRSLLLSMLPRLSMDALSSDHGADPNAGLKRLLHLATYLQIEPLVNLVAGYFSSAIIEVCHRAHKNAPPAGSTRALEGAGEIRKLMRVGHDWTPEEIATITRHTDWE